MRIYILYLRYAEDDHAPEVYRRIITHLHDSGDTAGASTYCTKAVEEGVRIQFARADLAELLGEARLGLGQLGLGSCRWMRRG